MAGEEHALCHPKIACANPAILLSEKANCRAYLRIYRLHHYDTSSSIRNRMNLDDLDFPLIGLAQPGTSATLRRHLTARSIPSSTRIVALLPCPGRGRVRTAEHLPPAVSSSPPSISRKIPAARVHFSRLESTLAQPPSHALVSQLSPSRSAAPTSRSRSVVEQRSFNSAICLLHR